MKHRLLFVALLLIAFGGIAQSKLAYVYGRESYENEQRKMYAPPIQMLGDTAIIISSSILMNVPPEKYSITFGLGQEAATPSLAGKLMNDRIQKFREALKKLDVADKEMYVDFVSQNKVYEYVLEGNKAIEKEAGFEIKKTVTIMFTREGMIEAMTEAAAAQQIFDVIKVEYFLEDHTPFYKQLFAEAIKQIKDRKDMYVLATGMELMAKTALYSDNLTVIFPSTQYKKYTAYESGDVESNYNAHLVKKELRKSSTAYYQGISQNNFDKVLNNNSPGIPVQMALGVSLKFYVKK